MQLKIDMNHFYNNNNKYLIIKLTLYLLHFIEPRFSMEHDSKSVSNEQEYNTKTSSKKIHTKYNKYYQKFTKILKSSIQYIYLKCYQIIKVFTF